MYFMRSLLVLPIVLIIATIAMIYCAYQIIRSIYVAKANSDNVNPNKALFYIGLTGSALYLIVEFIRFFLSLVGLFGPNIDFPYVGAVEAIAFIILGAYFISAIVKSQSRYKFCYAIAAIGVLLTSMIYFYNTLLQLDIFNTSLQDLSINPYAETISLVLLIVFFSLEFIGKISKEKNLPLVGLSAIVILLPANLFFYFDVLQFALYFNLIFIFIDTLYLISAMILTVYFIKKLIIKDNL